MSNINITLTQEQLNKIIEAYQTIQQFLASSFSLNELYQKEFLTEFQEAIDDIQSKKTTSVNSFDDFVN